MSQTDAEPSSLDAWPSPPEDNGATSKSIATATATAERSKRHAPTAAHDRTVTTTATPGISFREYLQYRELFHNLTLRELRSKYKRSVIGWGWSMINPIANMLIYTVVFSLLLQIKPPLGVPSGLHNYAIMLLAGMLPWNFFQGSIMESMGAMLGNQNLIQKTYFPAGADPRGHGGLQGRLPPDRDALAPGGRRLLRQLEGAVLHPGSHHHDGRCHDFRPRAVAAVLHGQRLLPGHPALLQHFVLHLDVPDPGGLPVLHCGRRHQQPRRAASCARPGTFTCSATLVSLGTIFKLNPMTDAVLVFQSFLYDGALPGSTHVYAIPLDHPRAFGHSASRSIPTCRGAISCTWWSGPWVLSPSA